jgi:hypothetical protein
MIEIIGENVFRDGEDIGRIANGEFIHGEGVHYKTVEKVNRMLSPFEPIEDKEPAKIKMHVVVEVPPAPGRTPEAGDKTPEYVRWLREYYPDHAAKKFELWPEYLEV